MPPGTCSPFMNERPQEIVIATAIDETSTECVSHQRVVNRMATAAKDSDTWQDGNNNEDEEQVWNYPARRKRFHQPFARQRNGIAFTITWAQEAVAELHREYAAMVASPEEMSAVFQPVPPGGGSQSVNSPQDLDRQYGINKEFAA